MISRNGFDFSQITRGLLVFGIIVLFSPICFGQKSANVEGEDFAKLTDGEVKREIASFTINGSAQIKVEVASQKPMLQEIAIRKCSNEFVSFEKGNIYDRELGVDAVSVNDGTQTRMKE